MPKNNPFLAKRFSALILDGTWIANTNFKQILSDVNLEVANKKIGSLNTIAKLTFHVNYYIEGVLKVLEGGTLDIHDKFSFDMPALKTEKEWESMQSKLYENSRIFARRVAELSNEKLNSTFVKEEYGDYRRNINGLIEHGYYHFGQIVLIKKLITVDQNKK